MKKRYFIGIVFCWLFMACEKATPEHGVEILVGNWLRVSSTDARSDSMTIHIAKGDSAVITSVPPNSNFRLQELKWRNITAIAESGDFQFLDLSADGTLWKAFIEVESASQLKIINAKHPNAPGGKQIWTKF
ncbi:hypothetical protein [Aureispira sp. CCB-QB1]|uniref:hypothetical protein n=1 Tax=Aureispira sp. CCB-QB1 TaxID=1313421 RepID=UPI0006972AF4|nr:hypothetical protein [Aureispira sp. CCB-QB1]